METHEPLERHERLIQLARLMTKEILYGKYYKGDPTVQTAIIQNRNAGYPKFNSLNEEIKEIIDKHRGQFQQLIEKNKKEVVKGVDKDGGLVKTAVKLYKKLKEEASMARYYNTEHTGPTGGYKKRNRKTRRKRNTRKTHRKRK